MLRVRRRPGGTKKPSRRADTRSSARSGLALVPQITALGRTEEGARTWAVRCMVPFELSTPSIELVGVSGIAARSEHSDGEELEFDGVDGGDNQKMGTGGTATVRGVASSTSADWYGTRMSLKALRQMEAQFKAGIDYLPGHGSFASPMEWDSVIGRSVGAEVAQADVLESKAAEDEKDYVLTVTTALDLSEPRAARLVARLESGRPVGQSVGGWFTDLQFTTDEDDVVTDIVVLGLKLDHLAVTRSPANPDASGLELVRAAVVRQAVAQPSVRTVAPGYSAERLAIRSRPEGRAVVPFQDLATAPEDTAWSFDTADQDAVLGDPPDWKQYKWAHVWFDADEDAEMKGAYKLPIAKVVDGNLRAVWNGVRAAMAALNGARGGVDIPEDERDGVYNHLKRYYDKFDKEPPELKSADVDEDAGAPERAQHGHTSQEIDMTDADLRRIEEMLGRVVAPLTERVAAVEQRSAFPQAPATTTAAPLDAASAEAKSLQDRLAASEQRAKAAEQQLAYVMAEPMRVGLHAARAIAGPTGKSTLRDLAERARGDAPSVAAVVTGAERVILDHGTLEERSAITGAALEETLAALCRAAFADGIWKEPEYRSAWS